MPTGLNLLTFLDPPFVVGHIVNYRRHQPLYRWADPDWVDPNWVCNRWNWQIRSHSSLCHHRHHPTGWDCSCQKQLSHRSPAPSASASVWLEFSAYTQLSHPSPIPSASQSVWSPLAVLAQLSHTSPIRHWSASACAALAIRGQLSRYC